MYVRYITYYWKIYKIDWYYLSKNPNAIHLLEKNVDKINWNYLSANPNAISLLEQNIDKIHWTTLSSNPNIFRHDEDDLNMQFEKLTQLYIKK